MLSNPRPVADYVVNLVEFLRSVEGFIATPYYDRAPENIAGEYQNVTIGDGINIDWSNLAKLKLVLSKFGLVDSSTQIEASRRLSLGLPAETPLQRVQRLDSMADAFRQEMIRFRPPVGASLDVVNARNLQNKWGQTPFNSYGHARESRCASGVDA